MRDRTMKLFHRDGNAGDPGGASNAYRADSLAKPITVRAGIRLAGISACTLLKIGHVLLRGLVVGNSDGDIARLTRSWCLRLCRILGMNVMVRGTVPESGALLVSNHRSYIDIGVIGSCLPCSFLAKAELRLWPVFGWAATAGRTVFVRRDSPESRRRSREEIRKKLVEGISFVVFPEGTTAREGLLPFRPGIFKTAAQEGYAVVPVAIDYEVPEDAWVDDDTFMGHFMATFGRRRVKAAVTFGTPLQGRDAGRLMRDARRQIEGFLDGAKPSVMNTGVYSETAGGNLC
jgi:1-acyl-sn-glycerol-3-phosphate acyltransferase